MNTDTALLSWKMTFANPSGPSWFHVVLYGQREMRAIGLSNLSSLGISGTLGAGGLLSWVVSGLELSSGPLAFSCPMVFPDFFCFHGPEMFSGPLLFNLWVLYIFWVLIPVRIVPGRDRLPSQLSLLCGNCFLCCGELLGLIQVHLSIPAIIPRAVGVSSESSHSSILSLEVFPTVASEFQVYVKVCNTFWFGYRVRNGLCNSACKYPVFLARMLKDCLSPNDFVPFIRNQEL